MNSILPQEILTSIYEYDNTYKEIFQNKVCVEIYKQSWRVWARNVNVLSPDDESEAEHREVMKSMFQKAITYWFDNWWISSNLWSMFGYMQYIHSTHPHDICVECGNQLFSMSNNPHYIIYMSNKYNRMIYFMAKVYPKKLLSIPVDDIRFQHVFEDETFLLVQKIHYFG